MDAPAVAVSRDGSQYAAAWMDIRSGGNNRRVYWNQLGVDAGSPVASIQKGIQGHPSMAMDSANQLHIAWEDFRDDVQRIHYRRMDRQQVAISPSDVKASFPSLACGKVVGVAFELGNDVVFATPPK